MSPSKFAIYMLGTFLPDHRETGVAISRVETWVSPRGVSEQQISGCSIVVEVEGRV